MKRSTWGLLTALFFASLPVAAGQSTGTVRVRTDDKADAYALVFGNQWMSMNASIDDIHRIKRLSSGDFLWFRRAARTYRIDDKTVLQEAKGLFAPLRALDPERQEIHRRERALDRQEQELDREEEEIDRIRDSRSDDDEDDEEAPTRVSDEELRDLERRSRELKDRMRPLREEQREIEALERAFDRKEEALEEKAETALWKLIDRAISSGMAQPWKN